ncbi:MAG: hypothetical protein ACKVS8_09055 [Phycisphaerales bacterium]
MNAPNLLPASVRVRATAAAAARRWAVATLAWAAALGAGTAGAAVFTQIGTPDLAARAAQLNAVADTDYAQVERSRKEAAEASKRLELLNAVSDHPDWSRLLALLSNVRGDDTLIESIEVSRKPVAAEPKAKAPKPGATAPPPPRPVYLIRLAGMAGTPAEATSLVLRLEQAGLFDRVTLVETQPREFVGKAVAAFRVECEVGDGAPSPATPRAPSTARQPAAAGGTP